MPLLIYLQKTITIQFVKPNQNQAHFSIFRKKAQEPNMLARPMSIFCWFVSSVEIQKCKHCKINSENEWYRIRSSCSWSQQTCIFFAFLHVHFFLHFQVQKHDDKFARIQVTEKKTYQWYKYTILQVSDIPNLQNVHL